tara:strand:+ start:3180 stop:4229 length:1050 start_codon:yes stop_codon:yes gene_type:complete
MSEINDIRTLENFRVSSFSKYKKTEVSKMLIKCLIEKKTENACYWSVEMICTGMYLELWNVIIKFISKYIYIGNPKLPIYILKRIDDFKNIIKNGYTDNELLMRNDTKLRQLFAEVIGVVISSNKKNPLTEIKVNTNDFQIHNISSKFLATDTTYIEKIYMKDDPKETYMAFNEFAYTISQKSKNTLMACYWIEWIVEYEKICKKNKVKCTCERRIFTKVDDKYQMSIIWILWEILLDESKLRGNYYLSINKSLLEIFCLRYSTSNNKKYKLLLYYAVYILCENLDTNLSFINDKNMVKLLVSNIDKFYKQIKQVEESPNTDYLFNGLKGKTSREKTIEKLDLLKKINN